MENVFVEYNKKKQELKDYHIKSAEVDRNYSENFPIHKCYNDRIEYNRKYEKIRKGLYEELVKINEELNKLIKQIRYLYPDFLVIK